MTYTGQVDRGARNMRDAIAGKHLEAQAKHASLTVDDFEKMNTEGCPVCKAQQKEETNADSDA